MSVNWEKLLTVDDVKYRTVNFDLTTRSVGVPLGMKGPIFLNENMDMVSGTGVSSSRNFVGDWSAGPAFNDGVINGVSGVGLLDKECVDETGLIGTDTACSYFTWPNSVSYPGQVNVSGTDLDIDLIEGFMGGTEAIPLGVNSHGMHELECNFIFSNDSENTDFGPACLPSVSVWRAYAPATASFPTTSLRFVLVATPVDLKRNPEIIDGGSYYINAPDHGEMNSFTFRKNIRVQSGSGDQDAGIVCYYAFGLHSFGSTTSGWVSFDDGDPHASSNTWPVTTGGGTKAYSVRAEGSIRYKSH